MEKIKSVEEIITQTPIIMGYWGDKKDIAKDFREDRIENINILFACYSDPVGYSGYAFVLFEEGGKLYEVHGSHCSCYGLEDQWSDKEELCLPQLLKVLLEEDEYSIPTEFRECREELLAFITK